MLMLLIGSMFLLISGILHFVAALTMLPPPPPTFAPTKLEETPAPALEGSAPRFRLPDGTELDPGDAIRVRIVVDDDGNGHVDEIVVLPAGGVQDVGRPDPLNPEP